MCSTCSESCPRSCSASVLYLAGGAGYCGGERRRLLRVSIEGGRMRVTISVGEIVQCRVQGVQERWLLLGARVFVDLQLGAFLQVVACDDDAIGRGAPDFRFAARRGRLIALPCLALMSCMPASDTRHREQHATSPTTPHPISHQHHLYLRSAPPHHLHPDRPQATPPRWCSRRR